MQLGDILDGKYRLERKLRSGGMGTVYIAERLALGDHVAVKVILSGQNTPIARARFLREAKAAARIRHPNVVQIFDFGEVATDIPYFVMEYLEGPTLDDLLSSNRQLEPSRATEIFFPVCAAVEAGHRRGVLHRDLKPGNVMLPRMDDGRETVKVLDFGLARFTNDTDTAQLTSPGALVGTYAYMAPEQILGEDVGPPCDVYSLGVMLYESVTGKLPFVAPSSFALMDKIVTGRYTPPEEIVPGLPSGIGDAVRAALRREPDERPASPEALAALVARSSASSTVDSQSPTPSPGSETPLRRRTDEPKRDTSAGVLERRRGPDTPTTDVAVTRTGDWPTMDCFVCRDAELETLKAEYASAARGDERLVVVVGEAGVGKTSLARAFGDWARNHGACVLTGRFFDYEGSRQAPFQTFLTMLASHCDPADAADRSSAEERIASLLGGTTTRGDVGVGDDAEKWRVFEAIAAEFARIAAERPLVLLFDDLQWAGRLHLELLAYLKRTLNGSRALVVGTARDADVQSHSGSDLASWLLGLGNLRSCTVLTVKPFDSDDVRTWLSAVFGRVRIRPLDVRRLQEATGGNPYYLYEVVRQLVASGRITRGADGWECAELDQVELPETIANAVRAKLRGLGDRARQALEAAAVVGDHFRFETLRAATGLGEDELDELLDLAMRQQVVCDDAVAPPNDFRFYSSTIRRVLYDDLSARRRKKLHANVVKALEEVYGDRPECVAGALGYHAHAVGDWAGALVWGLRAAEEAVTRADLEAAQAILARAREAADGLAASGVPLAPADAMRLDLLNGTTLVRLGHPELAKSVLRRASETAAGLGAAGVESDALLEYATCFLARGEIEEGVLLAERAARVAGTGGDRARALAARIVAGNALRRLGRTTEAEERFEAITAVLTPKDPASLQSLAYQNLAWIRTQRGRFNEGLELASRALELARAGKDPVARQLAYSTLAFVHDESGDREAAIRLHEESLRLSRALSFRRREGIDLANIGEALFRLGRHERALAMFEEALAIFVEIGDRACEGDCRVNLGRTLLAAGRGDDALAMLDDGLALCEATGRREYAAIALYYVGEASLARAAYADARAAFERARDIFTELEWHDSWRAEVGLARVAMAEGDNDAARRHVSAAVDRVEVARSSLPPTADYARFAREVEEVYKLHEQVVLGAAGDA